MRLLSVAVGAASASAVASVASAATLAGSVAVDAATHRFGAFVRAPSRRSLK